MNLNEFEKYWQEQVSKGVSMPVMPREKWDSVKQYVEYLRHLSAYMLFAREFIANKRVLEIGCGTGYGANYLSELASRVVAVDTSKECISYFQDKYGKDNLFFLLADALNLPFKDDSFDIVVSFQVIEHIKPKEVLNYLREIKRVLKTGGIFLVSTPNKRLRLLPFQKSWNPEHKKEYKDKELKKLLSKVFSEVKVYGLCGSKEVLSIEKNRVKQNPFEVYVMAPLYKMLKHILPAPILLQAKKLAKSILGSKSHYDEPIAQENFLNKFSLNDFKVDPGCPKDCIDLYGICTKVEK